MEDFRLFTSIRYDPLLLKIPNAGFSNTGWNQRPSPFYMLDLHRDRMLRAATYWGWTAAVETISGEVGLENLQTYLQSVVGQVADGAYRIKLVLSRDGTLSHEISPLPEAHLNNLFPDFLPKPAVQDSAHIPEGQTPSRDPLYEILLDYQTTATSEFTHYKTTNRAIYNDARDRYQLCPGDKKEVLLVNEDGQIMEGTVSTPYFWRTGKWVTPPVPGRFNTSKGSGGNDGTTRRWALERNLVVEQVVPANSLTDGEECWISNGLRGFICGKVKLR
ncbi:aminotransferase [Xylariaceae sp. FL0662B]|nr:aminotransferase [Xylariaceae sp. FL0662B]